MGMAAAQARFLGLTARKTNVEFEGQQINQQRTALGNRSADYYNDLLGMSVPIPPCVDNFTKTVYTFNDGALRNTVTAMIAKGAGNYTVSYNRQWVDDYSPVAAATSFVSKAQIKTADMYAVGSTILRTLGKPSDSFEKLDPTYTVYGMPNDGDYTVIKNPPPNDTYTINKNGAPYVSDIVLKNGIAGYTTVTDNWNTGITGPIYHTKDNKYKYYNGTSWEEISNNYRLSATKGGTDYTDRVIAFINQINSAGYNSQDGIASTYSYLMKDTQGQAANTQFFNISSLTGANAVHNGSYAKVKNPSVSGQPDTYTYYKYNESARSWGEYDIDAFSEYKRPEDTKYISLPEGWFNEDDGKINPMKQIGSANLFVYYTYKDVEGINGKITRGPDIDDANPLNKTIWSYDHDAECWIQLKYPQEDTGTSVKLDDLKMYMQYGEAHYLYTSGGQYYEIGADCHHVDDDDGHEDLMLVSSYVSDFKPNDYLDGISNVTDTDFTWDDEGNSRLVYINSFESGLNSYELVPYDKLNVDSETYYFNNNIYYEADSSGQLKPKYGNAEDGRLYEYDNAGQLTSTDADDFLKQLDASDYETVYVLEHSTKLGQYSTDKTLQGAYLSNGKLGDGAYPICSFGIGSNPNLYFAYAAPEKRPDFSPSIYVSSGSIFSDIPKTNIILDNLSGPIDVKHDPHFKTDGDAIIIKEDLSPNYRPDDYWAEAAVIGKEKTDELLALEEEYIQMLNDKYGKNDWLVRYVKDSKGVWTPYFYKRSEVAGALNGSIDSASIHCFTIGSETKTEEIKAVQGCQVERDSTGRFINIKFPVLNENGEHVMNGNERAYTTHALTVNTITDQEKYTDAMNQYEYEKFRYDQTVSDIQSQISIIQQQDKNLEIRIKQLDTEQKAIQTEMDAVSKVIEKNVESTFKTFG